MLKKVLKKLYLREKFDSKTFIKYLNKQGANIDNSCYFVSPKTNLIDLTRPYLIQIGKNVTITSGVSILTHGFDWSVLKIVYGEVIGSSGKVTIKNNCFIGVNSLLLKGITIGENSIIGAGSVVTKDIPPNTVAAGNPCKVICNLEEYYIKRKAVEVQEAKELIKNYYQRFGKKPPLKELAEYFWLFQNRKAPIPNEFIGKMNYGKEIGVNTNQKFYKSIPPFSSYEELCNNALVNMEE